MYHDIYMKGKGNVYKNKHVLMESIHMTKAEKARDKTLSQWPGEYPYEMKNVTKLDCNPYIIR